MAEAIGNLIGRKLSSAGLDLEAAIDAHKRAYIQPLMDILGPHWMLEAEAIAGLCFAQRMIRYGRDLRLIERRRRWIRDGWRFRREPFLRLSKAGWESE